MANLPFSEVHIKKTSKLKDFDIPSYQTDEAAGVDLSASIENSIKIRAWEREIIPCGIQNGFVTSMEKEGKNISLEQIDKKLKENFYLFF